MQRKFPELRGKMAPELENELRTFFNYLYDTIELLANRAGVSLEPIRPTSPSATRVEARTATSQSKSNSVGLAGNVLAQRLIGEDETSLHGIVPKEVLRSEMEVTAGIVPIDGFIIVADAKGNSKKVLITN